MKITEDIDTGTTRDFEKKILIVTFLVALACLAMAVKICLHTKQKTSENRVKIISTYSTEMVVNSTLLDIFISRNAATLATH